MTIPIYGVAFVCILVFCFLSDIRKERGNYISMASLIAGGSFIITVAVANKKVKYAFLCFAVGGVYAACPLTLLVRTLQPVFFNLALPSLSVGIWSHRSPR